MKQLWKILEKHFGEVNLEWLPVLISTVVAMGYYWGIIKLAEYNIIVAAFIAILTGAIMLKRLNNKASASILVGIVLGCTLAGSIW